MSSKYAPSRTPRKTPPWCKPGMYPVTPPIVDGKPTWLTAFVHWRDWVPGNLCDVTTTLRLMWDPATEEWTGHESGDHWNLGGVVSAGDSENFYTLEIQLYVNGEFSEGHEWENVPMGPDFPWTSGLQQLVTDPATDLQEMQVMA